MKLEWLKAERGSDTRRTKCGTYSIRRIWTPRNRPRRWKASFYGGPIGWRQLDLSGSQIEGMAHAPSNGSIDEAKAACQLHADRQPQGGA